MSSLDFDPILFDFGSVVLRKIGQRFGRFRDGEIDSNPSVGIELGEGREPFALHIEGGEVNPWG
jgi:hypothetical protein